jgi:hypothetical protein
LVSSSRFCSAVTKRRSSTWSSPRLREATKAPSFDVLLLRNCLVHDRDEVVTGKTGASPRLARVRRSVPQGAGTGKLPTPTAAPAASA